MACTEVVAQRGTMVEGNGVRYQGVTTTRSGWRGRGEMRREGRTIRGWLVVR